MSELRELLHAQANAVSRRYYKLKTEVMALRAENIRLNAENHALWRKHLRLHGAIRKHQAGHDKDRVCADDEILWLHLRPEPVAPEGVGDV